MIQPEDLIGKNVYRIGRAAAMCWIHFGRPVEINLRGRKRILGEFALELDCPWRIRNSSGGIELGLQICLLQPMDMTWMWISIGRYKAAICLTRK